ncbi:hypothetical protein B0H17DRAFT_1200311 [Mycena rosella]|uniref:Uncharacterized protein n=1 Tax=Mycena rosella TaxID=1033263 RepID=A0AAD7DK35_MYCRO|nr:hypothetical protein B0H17DRAFT_1200311 [Mycena rosella]
MKQRKPMHGRHLLEGENYEGGFLMINKGPSHQMRLLSLTSTVSHTSEAQLENIKSQISSISELYKRSPLGRRSQLNFEISDFLRLLKGMNGDHAADMKKTVRLVQAWKDEVCRIMLGYDEFQRMGPAEILEIVREIQSKNLEEQIVHGYPSVSHWDVAFTQLSPEAKHEINLFFWAGCSMHKELNCCRSFNEGMMDYYDDNPDIEPPVLLANRDNDATIQLAEETGQSTAAVQRALKVSERGGVKLISLFGALVNHKDDKKGLHDVYENYFRDDIGSSVRFPDTSNTRYQSHGLGGARIISHLEKHRQFMQFVKDHKTKRTLNHLEQNIVKGLYCLKTLAQIVLLVLFCMSLMHPYAHRVRGEGTEKLNILDLGPFHASVKAHIQKLIENPDILLFSSEDSYKLATLDGLPWSDLKAWSECVKLAPTLPDLKPLLLAGLKRALSCWERFTSEFEAGGLIDRSTSTERETAFMPSTNDANEGLLGMWRRFSRESPSSTVGHFADRTMFHRNETQEFMDTHMNSPEDETFLRQEARRLDESGLEKKRREELNAHKQEVVDEKREKDAKTLEKARVETERLALVGIERDRNKITAMKDKQLQDQLELHRRRGDKEVPIKARFKNKGERLAGLLVVLDRLDASIPAQMMS